MPEEVRECVFKITTNARVQMRAQIQFLTMLTHDEHGEEKKYEGGL